MCGINISGKYELKHGKSKLSTNLSYTLSNDKDLTAHDQDDLAVYSADFNASKQKKGTDGG